MDVRLVGFMIRDREVAYGRGRTFDPWDVHHVPGLWPPSPVDHVDMQGTSLVIRSRDGWPSCETTPEQDQSKQMWNWLPEMVHLKWTAYGRYGQVRWWGCPDDKWALLPILNLWQFGQCYQFWGNLSLQGHKDFRRGPRGKSPPWTPISWDGFGTFTLEYWWTWFPP